MRFVDVITFIPRLIYAAFLWAWWSMFAGRGSPVAYAAKRGWTGTMRRLLAAPWLNETKKKALLDSAAATLAKTMWYYSRTTFLYTNTFLYTKQSTEIKNIITSLPNHRVALLSERGLSSNSTLMNVIENNHSRLLTFIAERCSAEEIFNLLTQIDSSGNTVFLEVIRNQNRFFPSGWGILLNRLSVDQSQRIVNWFNYAGETALDVAVMNHLDTATQLLIMHGAVHSDDFAERQRQRPQPIFNVFDPVPVVQNGSLHQNLMNHDQNHMNSAVDQGCAESAIKLRNHYGRIDVDATLREAKRWFDQCSAYSQPVKMRGDNNSHYMRQQDLLPLAKRAFNDIISDILRYRDRSYRLSSDLTLTTKTLLAYVWKGLSDKNALQEQRPTPFNDTDIEDRRKTLIVSLSECQRGDNRLGGSGASAGADDGLIDNPFCPHGHFNTIISTLDRQHASVIIVSIPKDIFVTKGNNLMKQAFLSFSDKEKQAYFSQWNSIKNDPDADDFSALALLWDRIRKIIKPQLETEYKAHPDLLNNLQEVLDSVDNLDLESIMQKNNANLASRGLRGSSLKASLF